MTGVAYEVSNCEISVWCRPEADIRKSSPQRARRSFVQDATDILESLRAHGCMLPIEGYVEPAACLKNDDPPLFNRRTDQRFGCQAPTKAQSSRFDKACRRRQVVHWRRHARTCDA